MNKTKKKYQKSIKRKQTSKNVLKLRKKLISKVKLSSLPSFSFKNTAENKELKKQHSYAPTFHRQMTPLQSYSPERSIIGNEEFTCNDDEIYNSKTKKCYPWNSQIAKKIASKNLNSKKKFDVKDIIGPKQLMGNCWLNCFFVIYFISDKGYKFFRHLRKVMITGKDLDGKPITKNLHRLLFIFNKYIESIIRAKHSKINKKYALKLDTNVLIKEIYKNIKNENKKLIPNINEAGNIEDFYHGLLTHINIEKKVRKRYITHPVLYEHLMGDNENIEVQNFIEKDLYNCHIIVLIITNDDTQSVLSNKYFKNTNQKKPKEIKIKNRRFLLDSAVVLDNDNAHYSAYITINKKEYMFEGYSYARITPFKWKHRLNTMKSWKTFKSRKFENNYNSFMRGYQNLYYYRV
jgi:hypothetical protein